MSKKIMVVAAMKISHTFSIKDALYIFIVNNIVLLHIKKKSYKEENRKGKCYQNIKNISVV